MPRVSQLTEEKKQELLKLLADSNIDWLEVFKNFPGFNKIQLTNFAKKQKVTVSKKEEISPEEFQKNINKYADQVLKFLRDFGPASANTISEGVSISAQMVFRAIEEMARRGYQVVKDARETSSLKNRRDYWQFFNTILEKFRLFFICAIMI